jgi:dTDP-4-amino-4,6-dideoxygalactose transaminase
VDIAVKLKMEEFKRIYLSSPHMGGTEMNYIKSAFEQNWISPMGANVDGFENDIEKYVGVEHAVALSSGTGALHLALESIGVSQGDEVICQSLTFCGSANPIIYSKATPVFVDSETSTWNICPKLLEDAIIDRIRNFKKPKAIIYVHLYGMPAKVDAILEIGEKYGIPIIEDAAEALGSSYHEKKCGQFGDFSVLSFNGNKIITTSGGGALLTNSKLVKEEIKFLSTQARDVAPHYQHSRVGYNYRLSNVLAGIGRGQMEVLDKRVDQRRVVYAKYESLFREINKAGFNISMLSEPKGYVSNRWLTCILLDPEQNRGKSSEELRVYLDQFNIESRPLWKPMHMQPLYDMYSFYGNGVSERLFEIGLCLPSGSNMVDEDLDFVFSKIREFFDLN